MRREPPVHAVSRALARAFAITTIVAAVVLERVSATEQIHTLTAGEFVVEVATDTDRLASEFGPRFDRTAMVVSIRHGSIAWLDPRGLPDEFGLEGDGVLGWEDATPPAEFVKIGVGRLCREEPGPYRFWTHYARVAEFPVAVEASERAITIEQSGSTGRGDGYHVRKTYRLLPGPTLEVEYLLQNTGTRPFPFEHYNHHFFALPTESPAEATRVRFAPGLAGTPPEGWLRDGADVALAVRPTPARSAYWGEDLSPPATEAGFTLRRPDGATVAVRTTSSVTRFALWSDGAALCPELFVRYSIGPGETAQWSAQYHFEQLRADSQTSSPECREPPGLDRKENSR
jgi:hypothetical protein